MERVSIEGRCRKQQNNNKILSPLRPLKTMPAKQNLRPASPPKMNPWTRKQVPVKNENDHRFPPLPGAASLNSTAAKEDTESTENTESTQEKITALPSKSATQTNTNISESSCSISSDPSRLLFEAAAPKAMDNLWHFPFGADVILHTDKMTFRVHRSILERESLWFRYNLPSPNANGSPVRFLMRQATDPVGLCLRYMYTQKIEICEPQGDSPWDIVHLPRCVLAYCAAVQFRMTKLAAHILQIVKTTSTDIGALITGGYLERDMTVWELSIFSTHLINAMELMYSEGATVLMNPIKLAMAGFIDATLFWLIRQPAFVDNFLRNHWRPYLPRICAEQARFRRVSGDFDHQKRNIQADEAMFQALFEETMPQSTIKVARNEPNPENSEGNAEESKRS